MCWQRLGGQHYHRVWSFPAVKGIFASIPPHARVGDTAAARRRASPRRGAGRLGGTGLCRGGEARRGGIRSVRRGVQRPLLWTCWLRPSSRKPGNEHCHEAAIQPRQPPSTARGPGACRQAGAPPALRTCQAFAAVQHAADHGWRHVRQRGYRGTRRIGLGLVRPLAVCVCDRHRERAARCESGHWRRRPRRGGRACTRSRVRLCNPRRAGPGPRASPKGARAAGPQVRCPLRPAPCSVVSEVRGGTNMALSLRGTVCARQPDENGWEAGVLFTRRISRGLAAQYPAAPPLFPPTPRKPSRPTPPQAAATAALRAPSACGAGGRGEISQAARLTRRCGRRRTAGAVASKLAGARPGARARPGAAASWPPCSRSLQGVIRDADAAQLGLGQRGPQHVERCGRDGAGGRRRRRRRRGCALSSSPECRRPPGLNGAAVRASCGCKPRSVGTSAHQRRQPT